MKPAHLFFSYVSVFFCLVTTISANKRPWLDLGSGSTVAGSFSPSSGLSACVVDQDIYFFGGTSSGDMQNTMYKFDSGAGVVSSVTFGNSVPQARADFGMATVADSIYLFGGAVAGGIAKNDLWRADPSSLTWTEVNISGTEYPQPRQGLAMTAFKDALYVFGGKGSGSSGNTYYSDLQSFNVSTMSWTVVSTTGSAPAARSGHTLTALNGRLYVFGGFDGNSNVVLNDLHELNLESLVWSTVCTTCAPTARKSHSLVAVANSLYIIGGLDNSNNVIDDGHKFNPSTNSFTTLTAGAPLNGRSESAAVWIPGTGVYMIAGQGGSSTLSDIQLLNTAETDWVELTSGLGLSTMPTARYDFSLSAAENKLFLFGGRGGSHFNDTYGALEIYDPTQYSWSTASTSGTAPSARYSHTMVAWETSLYLFAGKGSNGLALNDLYQFSITANSWSQLSGSSLIPLATYQHSAAVINGTMFVFGGYNGNGELQNTLLSYSFAERLWQNLSVSALGAVPSGMAEHAMAAVGNSIYIYGGLEQMGHTSSIVGDIRQYNTVTKTWSLHSTTGDNLGDRKKHSMFAVNGKLYIFGGSRQNGAALDDFYELDPETNSVTDMSNSVSGSVPAPRYSFQAAELNGRTYMIGGRDGNSIQNGFFVVPHSTEMEYKSSSSLYSAYDGDILVIKTRGSVLGTQVHLCTNNLPCSLTVKGLGQTASILKRENGGFFSCAGSDGCESLTLQSFTMECADPITPDYPVFQSVLSTLTLQSMSVDRCSARSTGGSLRAINQATVKIEDSIFTSSKSTDPSTGAGGAIASFGSSITVKASSFDRCHSSKAGGAIYATQYTTPISARSLTETVLNSSLSLHSSSFTNNLALSPDGGGAIFLYATETTITSCQFDGNTAQSGGGGAVRWIYTKPTIPGFSNHLEMCGSGQNTASFGPCLGSSFGSLELSGGGNATYPVYPGMVFDLPLKARKLDYYGQVMSSDSITTVQAKASLGSSTDSNAYVTNTDVLVDGPSIWKLLNGEVELSGLTVSPKYKIDAPMGTTELSSAVYLFLEGTDEVLDETIRSSIVEIYFSTGRDVCPKGRILSLTSNPGNDGEFRQGTCEACESGSYSINPLAGTEQAQPSCYTCPLGATCSGKDNFETEYGDWEVSLDLFEYRLTRCPRGYVMVHDTNQSHLDECIECPAPSYVVDEVFFQDSIHVESSATAALASCNECVDGAICLGGAFVVPDEGFWFNTSEWDSAINRTSLSSLRRQSDDTSTTITAYRCQSGACVGEGECKEGHYGRVCGLCQEELGWVHTPSGCVSCNSDQLHEQRAVAWVIGILVLIILYYLLAWRPLFPLPSFLTNSDESREGAVQKMYSAVMQSKFVQKGDIWNGYLKIVIGFYQITSSFVSTFNISWPSSIQSYMSGSSVVSLDFLSFSSIACLSPTMSHKTRLLTYTIAPLLIIALLFIPAALVLATRPRGDAVRRQIIVNLWYNVTFLVFVIYPTCSSTILATWSCQDLGDDGNWLIVDYRVECPLDRPGSIELVWSIFAFLIYPVGSLALMLCILHHFQVPALARQKMKIAQIQAMMAKFIQDAEGNAIEEHQFTGKELDFREHATRTSSGLKNLNPFDNLSDNQLRALCVHKWDSTRHQQTEKLELAEKIVNRIDIQSGEQRPRGSEQEDVSFKSKVQNWNRDKMEDWILLKSKRLCRDEIIALPAIAWDGSLGKPEKVALEKAGFLFQMYETSYWWFEIWEMLRKLLMTSVLTFLYTGTPAQVAAGFVISFFSLVLTFSTQPYVSPHLDRLAILSLVTQSLTLFYGIMIIVKDQMTESFDSEQVVVQVVMLGLQISIIIIPFVQVLIESMQATDHFEDQVHKRSIKNNYNRSDPLGPEPSSSSEPKGSAPTNGHDVALPKSGGIESQVSGAVLQPEATLPLTRGEIMFEVPENKNMTSPGRFDGWEVGSSIALPVQDSQSVAPVTLAVDVDDSGSPEAAHASSDSHVGTA